MEKAYVQPSMLVDESRYVSTSAEELKSVLLAFTVCELPASHSGVFEAALSVAGVLPKQRRIQLSKKAFTIKTPMRSANVVVARLHQFDRLKYKDRVAALRSVSSLADYPNTTSRDWLKMATNVIKLGYAGDVYYALKNYHLNAQSVPLLRKAARKSGANSLANGLKKLEKAVTDLDL